MADRIKVDTPPTFTHVDAAGHARMVDVTAKAVTERRAVARCTVTFAPGSATELEPGAIIAAELAGTMAAKRTSDLIPLCHAIPVAPVTVVVGVHADRAEIEATATTVERTGVEMEALTACAVAALTLSSCINSGQTEMNDLTLWHKSGGRSGIWNRPVDTQ